MATYSLTVDIDPTWVTQYNTKGDTMCLCLAFGVSEAVGLKPNFNVVAAMVPGGQNQLSNQVKFSWVESYEIGATQQRLQNGVQIMSTTTALPISYGEHYALNADWSGGNINSDPNAPKNGFIFIIPPGDKATAVLYKPVASPGSLPTMAPFYISANGPLPAGEEILIPIITAQVWWQSISQSATMWDGFVGSTWTVVYPTTSATFAETVYFDNNGNWGNGPLPSTQHRKARVAVEVTEIALPALTH